MSKIQLIIILSIVVILLIFIDALRRNKRKKYYKNLKELKLLTESNQTIENALSKIDATTNKQININNSLDNKVFGSQKLMKDIYTTV